MKTLSLIEIFLLQDTAELDPDDGTDSTRVDQLKARRSSIVKPVADHAKNVKQKVL